MSWKHIPSVLNKQSVFNKLKGKNKSENMYIIIWNETELLFNLFVIAQRLHKCTL